MLLTLVGLNLREVYGVRPCRCGPNGVDTISVNEHTDYVIVSLLDVGDEFGCADDPILAHRFRVIACKALLSGRAIDDLAAQVGNVLADVFGTELVCQTVEILRQLHADVVRPWLRAPVA